MSLDIRRRALLFGCLLALACGRGSAEPQQKLERLRFGFIGTGELQPVGAEGLAFKRVAQGLAQRDFEIAGWLASE